MTSSDYCEVIELTAEESRHLFDKECQRLLGISGPDFLERYDRGDYDWKNGAPHNEKVCVLSVIIPFGRA